MSMLGAAGRLWTNAPLWRWSAIGAAAMTLVFAASVFMGNLGYSGTPPTPQVAQGTGTPAQPAPSAACAAAPAPAAVPNNVVMVTPSGPSRASLNRVADFSLAALAADAEQRTGERCVMLVDALAKLQQEDMAAVTCDPDAVRHHAEARRCVGEVALSDGRFAALIKAFDAFADDRSPSAVAHLAQSVAALTSFDRNRQLWNQSQPAIESGEAAARQIDASDQRLAALTSAAAAAAVAAPANGAIDALGTAAQQVTSFDRDRLNETQQAELAAGLAAAEQVAASGERLANLDVALALARTDDSAAASDRLIDAVVALEPFDMARASTEQTASIEEARTTAMARAQSSLVEASQGIDVAIAPPDQLALLANLRTLIADNGGLPAAAGATVIAAYAAAEQATAILADSDRRIAAIPAVMQSWKSNPAPAQEGLVLDAHAAITAFDQARLTPQQRQDFVALAAARDIISAMTTGLSPDSRAVAPIYVAAIGSDAAGRTAADALRELLIARGYQVVDLRDDAALTIELTWGGEQQQQLKIGSSEVETSVATVSMVATWTHRDEVVLRDTVRGEGRGFAGNDVSGQAIEDAASRLADTLDSAFEG